MIGTGHRPAAGATAAVVLAGLGVLGLGATAGAQEAGSRPTAGALQAPGDRQAAPTSPARTWSYGARGALTLLSQPSLDPGIGITAFAVRPLTTDLEFEGEAGYQFMNTVTNGLPAGRLALIPVRATLRVQMWRFGGAKPYLGGGAGFYLARFAIDDVVRQELNELGFGVSTSVDSAIGLHIGGGAEWQRDRWNVGVDVKYVFGNADAQSTVIDQATSEIFRETALLDLNGFWIAAGARFDF